MCVDVRENAARDAGDVEHIGERVHGLEASRADLAMQQMSRTDKKAADPDMSRPLRET
jgi:hypothetical protein